MRTVLAAISAAAILSLSLPPATAAPVAAGNNVVTKTEFKKVRKGWTMTRVHRVFDTNGKQTSFVSGDPEYCNAEYDFGCAYQAREYPAKGRYSYVSVSFEKSPSGTWRLESKNAYWG